MIDKTFRYEFVQITINSTLSIILHELNFGSSPKFRITSNLKIRSGHLNANCL